MNNVVLNEKQIKEVCKKLAFQIDEIIKKEDKIPVLIGVMRGAIPFMTDLVKEIKSKIFLDFLQISSYSGTKSTGTVQLVKDVSFDLTDRLAIIIEDIVDTGLSMKYLINHVKNKNARSVKVCALFDKQCSRVNDVKVDFPGVILNENAFVVGYGLDYNELLRNEPEVRILEPKEQHEIDELLSKKG